MARTPPAHAVVVGARSLASAFFLRVRRTTRAKSDVAKLGVSLGLTLCFGLAGGCPAGGKPPPLSKPVFPTGIAVDASGTHLVVVSSNFDFAFDNGAVLVANLATARAGLGNPAAVVTGAYVDAIGLPSLGDRPVLDASGQHLFVTTRGENLLHEIEIDGAGVLGKSPSALQLGTNDPFDVVLFGDDGSGLVRGLITHLSSNEAEIFTLNAAVTGASRLSVGPDVVFFGDNVTGVRSAVLRPAAVGGDEQVFVTLQRQVEGILSGTSLGVFSVPAPRRGDDVEVAAIDLTAETGCLNARGIAVVPDRAAGRPDGAVAVIVALRSPDALARFAWDDDTGAFALTDLRETCEGPMNLAVLAGVDEAVIDGAVGVGGVDRVLLTCANGEVVQALDPLTLQVQDSLRFFGRSPYAIAVDPVHGEAFVSFFLDDSIGVLDLVDDDGAPQLAAIGRIGTQLPPPQDGRE